MFLATHGLSEYWPEDQELVLLSPGCITAKNKEYCEQRGYQVIPTLWADLAWREKASKYLVDIYEHVLDRLHQAYQKTFDQNLSALEFRALMGSWLQHFVQVTYDRYTHIKLAVEQFDISRVNSCEERRFRPPYDEPEFFEWLSGDFYSLELCGQIVEIIFPKINFLSVSKSDTQEIRRKQFFLKNILSKAEILFWRIFGFRAEILHEALGVNRLETFWLFWKSRGKIQPLTLPNQNKYKNYEPDQLLRTKIELAISCGDSKKDLFWETLNSLLPKHIPIGLLEEFNLGLEKANKNYFGLKHLYSGNSVICGLPNRYFQAKLAGEKKLSYCQHGGGYGMLKYFPVEDHEKAVSKSYYVWGWGDEKQGYKNWPSFKLSRLFTNYSQGVKSENSDIDILLVMTWYPRFFYRDHSVPIGSQWEIYVQNADLFLKKIRKIDPKTNFSTRPYPSLNDRYFPAELTHTFSRGADYLNQIKCSKLVVFDHCMTGILEILILNHPTLFYWRPELFSLRESAKPYFTELERVGIYHQSPEAAADHIKKIWGNVNSWWVSEEVQLAREHFVNRYALADQEDKKSFLKMVLLELM